MNIPHVYRHHDFLLLKFISTRLVHSENTIYKGGILTQDSTI